MVANTKENEFLLQSEVLCINKELKYQEYKYDNDIFRGYFNKEGQKEGVGVYIFENGNIETGELSNDKLNGIARIKDQTGDYLGQYLDDKKEGYGTWRFSADGKVYRGQFKNDMRHGYGIQESLNGETYSGQWFEGKCQGYGLIKFANGDEYDGQFKNNKKDGTGFFKDARTGIAKKVLEV